MHPKNRHRLRSTLDALEAREVPAWLSSAWPLVAPVSPAPSDPTTTAVVSQPAKTDVTAAVATSVTTRSDVGNRLVSFLEARLGQRVGGGECTHLVVEALRASGAKFAWMTAATTDYAWGTKLTGVTGTASGGRYGMPTARFQPGDVIQFTNARFRNGSWFPHHTAIVASVDANGRVMSVYQQNFNRVRAVTKQPLDLSQLVAGYVKVYRPVARTPAAGAYGFTVVNNTSAPVTVVERAGSSWTSYVAGSANTAWSYRVRGWSTWGGMRPSITVAGKTIAVDDASAYEVYNSGAGIAIRKIG